MRKESKLSKIKQLLAKKPKELIEYRCVECAVFFESNRRESLCKNCEEELRTDAQTW